ncbi:MAG: hypothetical protein ACSW8D_10920, partial [Prevotella sp.]
EYTVDSDTKTLSVKGTPQQEGDYRVVVRLTGLDNVAVYDTIVFRALDPTGITDLHPHSTIHTPDSNNHQYDLQGRPIEGQPRKGVFIENRKKRLVR